MILKIVLLFINLSFIHQMFIELLALLFLDIEWAAHQLLWSSLLRDRNENHLGGKEVIDIASISSSVDKLKG